jgi:hypothetical protein
MFEKIEVIIEIWTGYQAQPTWNKIKTVWQFVLYTKYQTHPVSEVKSIG